MTLDDLQQVARVLKSNSTYEELVKDLREIAPEDTIATKYVRNM